jgi:hypothetical protein
LITTDRRPGGLVVFVAAATVAAAAFSATGSSHAANLGKRSSSPSTHRGSAIHATRASYRAGLATDNSTRLLDQWAACERSNGDPNQADPTVEHQVIYIAAQTGALANWDPNDATATCGQYLAAARNAVAGGQPATHLGAGGSLAPGWGNNAKYVQHANCMRANGYPTFPYPSGKIEPDGNGSTNFNGTGIDPNSPAFLNGSANQTCGKQIGAPAWWINNWGPPGSVDVYPAGTNPNSPLPSGPPATNGPKPSIAPGVNPASAVQAPAGGALSHTGPSAAAG